MPVCLCERMWPFICVCVCTCVCGQILMDGHSGEVSVSNMAVRVSWDRLQQMAERGRRLGELQQACPPPRGRWRAEERKRILKFGGRERRGASSVSPLKMNACSGHLERFTISSTHGCILLDNKGGTTELKSVVKLSDVT